MGGVLEDRRIDLHFEVWAERELTDQELRRSFRAWVRLQDPKESLVGARVKVRADAIDSPEPALGG